MDDLGVRISLRREVRQPVVLARDVLDELLRMARVIKRILEHGVHVDELIL